MCRMAKAKDRMPSQRNHAQLDAEAAVCEAKLEAIEWAAYAYKVRNAPAAREAMAVKRKREKGEASPDTVTESRETATAGRKRRKSDVLLEQCVGLLADARVQALKAETAAAEAAKEAAAEKEAAATAVQKLAAEQEARTKAAQAELEAAQLAQRRVRLKLKGRFHQSVRGGAAAISPEPPLAEVLPPGCRLLDDAIPGWEVGDAIEALETVIGLRGGRRDPRVMAIRSGQRDLKRLQVKMEESEQPIFSSLRCALQEAGEVCGRRLSEYNVLSSQPTCANQELHWDYDPQKARYAGRGLRKVKPCSAILGLQPGARLYVYDSRLRREVTVLVPPGAVLLFDGDVAHRGASYAGYNTRVHMYLDVEGVECEQDYVWFPEYE